MRGDRGNFLEEKDIATVRNGIEAQKFIKSVTKIVKKNKVIIHIVGLTCVIFVTVLRFSFLSLPLSPLLTLGFPKHPPQRACVFSSFICHPLLLCLGPIGVGRRSVL